MVVFASLLFGSGAFVENALSIGTWLRNTQVQFMEKRGYTYRASSEQGDPESNRRMVFEHEDTGEVKTRPFYTLSTLQTLAQPIGRLLFYTGLSVFFLFLIKLGFLVMFYARSVMGQTVVKWFCGIEGVLFIILATFGFLVISSSIQPRNPVIGFVLREVITFPVLLLATGMLGCTNLVCFFVYNFLVDFETD